MQPTIATAVIIMLITIGIGVFYSAIIGEATVLNLPRTLVNPITNPKYQEEKYCTVAKYKKQKAQVMPNLIPSTAKGISTVLYWQKLLNQSEHCSSKAMMIENITQVRNEVRKLALVDRYFNSTMHTKLPVESAREMHMLFV